MRWLTAVPVYNEARHVRDVLARTRRSSPDILVVNDGSTDGTAALLDDEPGLLRIDHPTNRGYGAALISAFAFALKHGYDVLVTMDCDGQHEPSRIPLLLEAIQGADIVSGSRYLRDFQQDGAAPQDRRRINRTITRELNERCGLNLTDAFCGFKAYRTEALKKFEITDLGYAMPLQVWVQAAQHGMSVVEVAVPLIYLDESRAFGGALDDAEYRLNHYREVFRTALARAGMAVAGGCC